MVITSLVELALVRKNTGKKYYRKDPALSPEEEAAMEDYGLEECEGLCHYDSADRSSRSPRRGRFGRTMIHQPTLTAATQPSGHYWVFARATATSMRTA
eukprot:scaffold6514_cov102-Cylindrotheca_fusiformis.AAC.2